LRLRSHFGSHCNGEFTQIGKCFLDFFGCRHVWCSLRGLDAITRRDHSLNPCVWLSATALQSAARPW
jgi:hypothetical protein